MLAAISHFEVLIDGSQRRLTTHPESTTLFITWGQWDAQSPHASFCIFLVACGFTPAQAQTNVAYGELYGVVTSPGGGSIPGATVTLENAATGLKRQTTTNLSGAYRFLLISPGSYEVRVERSGFRGADRKGVEVFVGQATALDVRMELGQLPQSVLVEESRATVDTQQAHPASFMGEAWIRDLPIDRRDFLTFVLLAPGVSDAKGLAGDTGLRAKQTPTSGLSFFGSNGRGNTVTVDGGEMNDGSGGVRSTISQEAVQEFQTNRGNYSAEIGGGERRGDQHRLQIGNQCRARIRVLVCA